MKMITAFEPPSHQGHQERQKDPRFPFGIFLVPFVPLVVQRAGFISNGLFPCLFVEVDLKMKDQRGIQ
jgi:hypothetical protein